MSGSDDEESSGAKAAPSAGLRPLKFWGICDLKYDPRLPERECIKVLELGDGKLSRFSNHGEAILEKLRREYCNDRCAVKRSMLVDNKRLTHDRFVEEGYAHLRPLSASFPRRYSADLAERVLLALRLQAQDAVVLKLCNRSRGAGVLVVHGHQVDAVLQKLLTPPEGKHFTSFIARREAKVLQCEPLDDLEEHCLHWWSNECPVFLAETCCHSLPVAMHKFSDHRFDGTLRVAFALRGKPGVAGAPPDDFELDWLGGYWKLPPLPIPASSSRATAGGDDVAEMRKCLISSFNTQEKRTAPVAPEHLAQVYACLHDPLLRVFRTGAFSVKHIHAAYKSEALLSAFLLARASCSLREARTKQALGILDMARRMVLKSPVFEGAPPPTAHAVVAKHVDRNEAAASSLPEHAVLSYIDRNAGVCHLMQKAHKEANTAIRSSLALLPTNATARYVHGRFFEELKQVADAAPCMLRAVALDPDFKVAYIMLGSYQLRLGRYQEAILTCQACLHRHPVSPFSQFIRGQALYHMLREGSLPPEQRGQAVEQARSALRVAKEHAAREWKAVDEAMLQYTLAEPEQQVLLPRQAVHTWSCNGWRP